MHKLNSKTKKIICVVVIIFVALYLPYKLCYHSYTLHGTKFMDSHYVQEVDLNELGDYDKLKYQYHTEVYMPFGSDASTTTAFYSEENFNKQLDYINNSFKFMDDYYIDYWGDRVNVQSKTDVNNWCIRVVDIYDDGIEYPKNVKIIAHNAKEKKIAYIDFFDSDLDSFGSLESFVEGYCGYKL